MRIIMHHNAYRWTSVDRPLVRPLYHEVVGQALIPFSATKLSTDTQEYVRTRFGKTCLEAIHFPPLYVQVVWCVNGILDIIGLT